MIKLTQTNLRQQLTNCLSLFDHFVGLALKGLNIQILQIARSKLILRKKCSKTKFPITPNAKPLQPQSW